MAHLEDLDAVAAIYGEIHTEIEEGRAVIGWKREIYPVRRTAEGAIEKGTLYLLLEEGVIRGSAIIDQVQLPAYAEGNWKYPAPKEQVLVLHTLAISPKAGGRGLGKAFMAFYEEEAKRRGCPYLRIDTNAKNQRARTMYDHLGYREAGIIPCNFQGLDGVDLVLLEKKI
ncbi:MAG: GNAT family N-acetyltransferase [Blautia sp.]|nr:GNAT family N-acetyltransferase [Blautia sp.]